MPQDIINDITAVLKTYPEVLPLAFLFGSFAAGRATAESDVDVALLCRPSPSFDRREEIRSALCAALKREVDLIFLDEASPILRMQVLEKGIPLIRDDAAYAALFVRTVDEYDDLKRVRRKIEERILQGAAVHA